jgi:hypothetical protein
MQNATIMLAPGKNAAGVNLPENRWAVIISVSIFMPKQHPSLPNNSAFKHAAMIGRQWIAWRRPVVVKILTARAVECSLDIKSGQGYQKTKRKKLEDGSYLKLAGRSLECIQPVDFNATGFCAGGFRYGSVLCGIEFLATAVSGCPFYPFGVVHRPWPTQDQKRNEAAHPPKKACDSRRRRTTVCLQVKNQAISHLHGTSLNVAPAAIPADIRLFSPLC